MPTRGEVGVVYYIIITHFYHFIVDISTFMSVPGGDCRKLEPGGLRDGALGDCLPLLPLGVNLPEPIGGRGGVLENWDSLGMRTPLPADMTGDV